MLTLFSVYLDLHGFMKFINPSALGADLVDVSYILLYNSLYPVFLPLFYSLIFPNIQF